MLDRQGDNPFLVRVGGQIVVADEKDRMKSEVSNRVIRLPRQLMDLIRVVIEAFHTDPVTGEVGLEARLILGLRAADCSGQSAHRAALKSAIAAAEIDTKLYGTITPHELRAYLATDLKAPASTRCSPAATSATPPASTCTPPPTCRTRLAPRRTCGPGGR